MNELPLWARQISEIANDPANSDVFGDVGNPVDNKDVKIGVPNGLLLPTDEGYRKYLRQVGISMSYVDGAYKFGTQIAEKERRRTVSYAQEVKGPATIVLYESGTSWRLNDQTYREAFARRTTIKPGQPIGLAEVVKASTSTLPEGTFFDLQVGTLAYPFLVRIRYGLGYESRLAGMHVALENLEDIQNKLKTDKEAYPLLVNDWNWILNSTDVSGRDFLSMVFGEEELSYSIGQPPNFVRNSDEWSKSAYNKEAKLPGLERHFMVQSHPIRALREDTDFYLMDAKRRVNDPFVLIKAGSQVGFGIASSVNRFDPKNPEGLFEMLPIQAVIKVPSLEIDYNSLE